MKNRPSFEKIALETAKIWSSRSEDPYKKVGCVILDQEKRILSMGYNGVKPNQIVPIHFWNDRDQRRIYMIHAETNALSCISRYQNPFLIASTLMPCSNCAMNISSYGIKKVLYLENLQFKISLTGTYWDKKPQFSVWLDNHVVIQSEIVSKSEQIINFERRVTEGPCELKIRLENKTNADTNIKNGEVIDDMILTGNYYDYLQHSL
jgi:dCMP deaminase